MISTLYYLLFVNLLTLVSLVAVIEEYEPFIRVCIYSQVPSLVPWIVEEPGNPSNVENGSLHT